MSCLVTSVRMSGIISSQNTQRRMLLKQDVGEKKVFPYRNELQSFFPTDMGS